MQKELAALKSSYSELINKKLFKSFEQVIRDEIAGFVELDTKIHEEYSSGDSSRKGLISTKQSILNHTAGYWSESDPVTFSEFAEDFLSNMTSAMEWFPEVTTEAQLPERFKINKSDPFHHSFLKTFKIFFWQISQLPNRILKKRVVYWKHQVPVQNVILKHLVYQVYRDAQPLLIPHYSALMEAYIKLYAWESSHQFPGYVAEGMNFSDALTDKGSQNRKLLKKQLKDYTEVALDQLQDALERVGTIELSAKKYRRKSIEREIQKLEEKWIAHEKGWSNTFDVFLESWRSELTLQTLVLQAGEHLDLFLEGQSENINRYVGKELDEIDNFIKEAHDQIEEAGESLPGVLKQCMYKAKKTLDQEIIPALLDKIGNKNMVNGIARLEASVFNDLEALATKRRISKEPIDFLRPLRDDEITITSPQDLIKFESAPKLAERFGEARAELVNRLNDILHAAQDTDHMILYGLTASLEEHVASKDASAASIVALKSLNRSAARVNDIRNSIKQCIDESNEAIIQAVTEYSDALNRLTKNENYHELRLRVIKAKAIKSGEEYKNVVFHWLSQTYNNARDGAQEQYLRARQLIRRYTRKFNLNADNEVNIEVSNFLIDSVNLIDSLPLIYRNLYQIKPVTDQELFVGRENELNQLTEAYRQWTDNKKGAVAIIGEKWSGLTSIVNMIQGGDYLNYHCNRFTARSSHNIREELFTFFEGILDRKLKEDSSWSELAELFNSGARKVVIIEDVHCAYFRKIGGFDVLMGLSELIQSTSQQVFWIVTCNLYVWQYLQRTLQFDEFFRYHIELQAPTEKEIEELIQKRNRISGYKPHFLYSESFSKSKKFMKSSEEEQQKILKEKFFQDLIRYSSSNISMALMFYLLSTKEIKGDRIEITEFNKPDFAFLSALPMDRVTTLHLLILHDGLTLEQYSALARIPGQTSKLLLGSMFEDGILIRKDGSYVVNPLIYKSVISLLKAKNLL